MKKAFLITAFDNYSYSVRTKYVEEFFVQNGYEHLILAADFDHRLKKEYTYKRKNLHLIHVPEYQNNLSLARINSHRVFAKEVFKYISTQKADVIYICTPPNYLLYYAAKYKKRNPNVRFVLEVGDMWPETLPVPSHIKKVLSPFLYIWASIRNRNLFCADGIMFECNLFREHLKKYTRNIATETVYLCKKGPDKTVLSEMGDTINFLYIGSINNIIDIELIGNRLELINAIKPCSLQLIGDGERKKELLDICSSKHIVVIDHGIVYDEERKSKIIGNCHYALNVMKSTVFVGATMKSLDYFSYGIPVVNTIQGDTAVIVDEYNCGVNVDRKNLNNTVENIINISEEERKRMGLQSKIVFDKFFSEASTQKGIAKFFEKVLSDN